MRISAIRQAVPCCLPEFRNSSAERKALRRQAYRFQQVLYRGAHRIVIITIATNLAFLWVVIAKFTSHAKCGAITRWYYVISRRGGSSNNPAIFTNSARDPAFIFFIARPRWIFTVTSLVPSSAAIAY